MFQSKRFNLHRDESGQTALETAIILIAFVVVASVFAFTILSAGNASTEKGQQAIYAGLQGVTSSMEVKGAVLGKATTNLDYVIFTVALVSGGDPVDLSAGLTTGGTPAPALGTKTTISYRDATQPPVNNLKYAVDWPVKIGDNNMLEAGELAEITVDLTATGGGPATPIPANRAFTLEIKPPNGTVIQINRTTPAALSTVMELR